MTASTTPVIPIIDSILHPSDFSEASRVAFAHALKAALITGSRLTMLHVTPANKTSEWDEFPRVRETLERWALIPAGSHKSAVPKLGIDVNKVIAHDNDPVNSVLHYLDRNPTDMIVLATHQHEGMAKWLKKSVAQPIARKSHQMTLFVPDGANGFVSLADGSVSLTSILIPIAAKPKGQSAVVAAARLVRQLKCPAGTFTLLHVGEASPIESLGRPNVPGWTWNVVARTGDVIDGIVKTADETKAELIVMSTDGRHGFLDALRGSHSERVVRQVACPLLAIPEDSLAAGDLRW